MPVGNLGTLRAKITADASGFEKAMGRAKRLLKGLGKAAAIGGAALAGIGTAAAAKLGTDAVMSAAKFEDAVASAAAKVDATEATFNAFADAATQAGQTSMFSATQAANALKFLSQAGLSAEESTKALAGTLELAEAGEMDLATAADIATNVLSGMAMEVDELGRVNDVLVKTATSANTNVVELGQAFSLVAPVAKGAGVSLEQTSGMLGIFANAGIKATRAGTTLRAMISKLQAPSEKASDIIGKLGVNVTDSQGKLRNMAEIMGDFSDAGMTSAQAMEVFGLRAGPGAQIMLQQGERAVKDYTRSLENAGGTAKEQADFLRDSFGGQLEILKGSFETLLTTIGQQFTPILQKVASHLTDFTNDLRENDEMLSAIQNAFKTMLPVIGGVLRFVGDAVDRFSELSGVIGGVIGIITGNGVGGFTSLTTAGNKLNAALDKTSDGLVKLGASANDMLTDLGRVATKERELREELANTNLTIAQRIKLENELENTELRRRKIQLRQAKATKERLADVMKRLSKIQDRRSELKRAETKGTMGSFAGTAAQLERRLKQRPESIAPGRKKIFKKAIKRLKNMDSAQKALLGQASELRDKYGETNEVVQKYMQATKEIRKQQKAIKDLGGETAEEMAKVTDPDPDPDPDPLNLKEQRDTARELVNLIDSVDVTSPTRRANLIRARMAFDDPAAAGVSRSDAGMSPEQEQKIARARQKEQQAELQLMRAKKGTAGPAEIDQLERTLELQKLKVSVAERGKMTAKERLRFEQLQGQQLSTNAIALRDALVTTEEITSDIVSPAADLASELARATGQSEDLIDTLSGLGSVLQSGVGAASAFASGNIIGGISGVLGLATGVAGMFGRDDAKDKPKKTANQRRDQRDLAKMIGEEVAKNMKDVELADRTINVDARRALADASRGDAEAFLDQLERIALDRTGSPLAAGG